MPETGQRLLFAAAGALLLMAAWNPPLGDASGVRHWLVLVDESASMAGSARNLWPAVAARLRSTGDSAEVLGFAAGTREILAPGAAARLPDALPGRSPIAAERTDLAGALDRAIPRLDRVDAAPALLLLSDLRVTTGGADRKLATLAARGVEIRLLRADADGPPDWRLDLPARAAPGEAVPASVALSGPPGRGYQLEWRLDGQPIESVRMNADADGQLAQRLWLRPDRAGRRVVEARLGWDGGSDRRQAGIRVESDGAVLWLGDRPAPALATAWADAGRRVIRVDPLDWAPWRERLDEFANLVLDDVAVAALEAADWRRLSAAVRGGKGLAVLGGPRSFGAGGYRRSDLESILPVTAEAGPRRQTVAAVFLLDVSGSMGADAADPDRLGLASDGLRRALGRFEPGDRVGLIEFADRPSWRLPMGAADPARLAALLDWGPRADGGTAVLPALELALAALSAETASRRLLVVLTDGFAETRGFEAFNRQRRTLSVGLLAIGLGSRVDRARLAELAEGDGDRWLHLADALPLPRLLPGQVDRQTAALHSGRVEVAQRRPLAGRRVANWPPLQAYAISRARAQADTILVSALGDPLLVRGSAGAGRVLALPGGLGAWASEWPDWPEWPWFSGALLGLLDGPGSDRLDLRARARGQALDLELELLNPDQTWGRATGTLTAVHAGSRQALGLEPLAAGLYRARFEPAGDGHYRFEYVEPGRAVTLDYAYLRSDGQVDRAAAAALRALAADGRLAAWEESLAAAPATRAGTPRGWLLAALGCFVLALLLPWLNPRRDD